MRREVAGYLTLGARTAGALGRIAADRIGEGLGRALPRTPRQLARPEVVGALLRDHAAVRAVSLPGVVFESSNCTNFLVELDWKTD